MMDLATPLEELRNQVAHHHHHHPSRWLVFSIGLIFGALAAIVGAWTYEHRAAAIAAPVPVWDTQRLTCAGYDGAFYVHNTTDRNIRLEPESVVLLDQHELGLSLSASKLTRSVFIPGGEAVALPISPEPESNLVLFDRALKLRVDLNK